MKLILIISLIAGALSATAAKTTAIATVSTSDSSKCELTMVIGLATDAPTVGFEVVVSLFRTAAEAIASIDYGITCFATVVTGPLIDGTTSGCQQVQASSASAAAPVGTLIDYPVVVGAGTNVAAVFQVTFTSIIFPAISIPQTSDTFNKVYAGANEAATAVAVDYLVNGNTAASSGQVVFNTTCIGAQAFQTEVSDARGNFVFGLMAILFSWSSFL